MFISQAMMIILFKTLTLVILSSLVIYGYISYARPMLQSILDDFHNSCSYLLKIQHALDQQQQEIEQYAQKQQVTAQALLHKIMLWQQCVQKNNEIQIQKMHKEQKHLADMRQERNNKVIHERLRMHLMLQAVDEAEQALINQYQQQQQGELYVHTMLQTLRKNES